MNGYGRMAQEHWGRFLPGRVATLEDPARFFTELGQEVEDQVTTLATSLAAEDPVGESYEAKVGRLMNARQRAEEVTLRELVLLPAEPGSPMDEDSEVEEPETTDPTAGATPSSSMSGWHPVVEDPSDPFWATVDR